MVDAGTSRSCRGSDLWRRVPAVPRWVPDERRLAALLVLALAAGSALAG